MPDAKDLLEHALETATAASPPPPDDFDRFARYRDRRHRNQRLAAGAVALLLAVVVIGSALAVFRTSGNRRPGSSGTVLEAPNAEPCFAPDPCWDQDLYLVRTDGTGVTRIGFGQQREIATSWSPDGTRIAFAVAVGVDSDPRAFNAAIATAAVDGSDVRELTDSTAINVFPAYSPDGTRIVFQSDRSGTHQIWVMNADGSDPVQLTDFSDGPEDSYAPTWSPEGTQIAFVRGDIPSGGPGELWAIDADGSNAYLLLADPLADFPSWSPDGTRIAFETGDFPDVRVAILDLATRTVSDLGPGFHPIWSPDGSRLAVSIPDGSGGFGLVDPAAPNRVQIISPTGWAAAWSPDGEQILFNDAGPSSTTRAQDGAEPILQAPAPGDAIAGFTESGIPFLAVRHDDGSLTAVEAVSPHLATGNVGKIIGWCASSRTFDDKFHGARFDEYGRYISGPSPSGLVPISIEVLNQEPLTFRLGEPLPTLARGDIGERPTGPFCMDTDVTPLLEPDIAESGMTPGTLAASEPPAGSRWSVVGTLVLSPDGAAHMCASFIDGTCEAGAPVTGPTIEGGDPLVVEGTWFVFVRDGMLADPIRAA